MTTQQIKYVLTLAEEKSFSAAAKKLFISQPSFSQYIANIESQYGVKLFDRSTKPISLTQEGKAYVRAAVRIQSIEKDFIQEINDFDELKSGELHIGASTFRTSHMLAQSIMAFTRKYPGITLSVVESDIRSLFEMLSSGKIELIIGSGPFYPQDTDVTVLSGERVYLAASDKFLDAEEYQTKSLSSDDLIKKTDRLLFTEDLAPEELCNLPFICCKDTEFGEEKLKAIFESYNLNPPQCIMVQSLETAFSMTLAGLGVSIIPDTMIRFGNFRTHPFYYSLPECISEDTINMYTRKNAHISKAAREYGSTLKELIAVGTWRI